MTLKSLLTTLVVAGTVALCSCEKPAAPAAAPVTPSPAPAAGTNVLPSIEAAQSIIVTHDLDFGGNIPGLEAALRQIERRHQPEDGAGRTFAILEAFTQPGAEAGKLRLSLRVSTEKPGVGEITFRGAKETKSLWKSRITPATKKSSFTGGELRILFDNGDGKQFNVDGSAGPPTIFDAQLKEMGVPIAQVWPEGAVRDLVFIYSACGCPIHVKCQRAGDRTVRTEAATQVIFPDDPSALQVISRLMRW